MPTLFRFINTSKYPASLQFLLMTLGPMILLLPLADRARGNIDEFFSTFGRVPMFYYLLHIPAIHLAAVLVSLVREGGADPWLFTNHPMMNPPPPDGYTWRLSLLYAVFIIVVGLLYFPCHWYAGKKINHPSLLTRYI
jgi:formate hydrogenlyase subunit 3/multisubunit Na+/H+ antiporter MnhD subunit